MNWLEENNNLHEENLRERIIQEAEDEYKAKEALAGEETMRHFEKGVMLQTLDELWKEHLAAMDYLRQGIHLRGYAQKDPKQEYKKESFRMFMPIVAPGGICVISDMVTCDTNIRDDVTVVRIPCMQIADEIGNPKGANIIMTGAIIHLVKDFTKEEAIEAMNNMFAKKGKAKFAESGSVKLFL